MNALILTIIRFGFLALLWVFIGFVITLLRRDLLRPAAASTAGATRPVKPVAPKAEKNARNRASRKSGPGRITILDGLLAGTVITLTGQEVLFGRAAECSVVLNDDYVSNHHCVVKLIDSTWVLHDLGSTNGTWINRTRVTATVPLKVGLVFSVGRVSMRVDT